MDTFGVPIRLAGGKGGKRYMSHMSLEFRQELLWEINVWEFQQVDGM